MGLLSGKKALIVGLANNRSIAAGIASAFAREGAELALAYQNEKLKGRVEKIAEELNTNVLIEMDVSDDSSIENAFSQLKQGWDNFDILIHSVAFAPSDHLDGDYLSNVTREGFKIAHDVSSFSFAALAKAAQPMLNPNSALLTLTYMGSNRVAPNYNVMGLAKASLEANVRYLATSLGPQNIRVNAISAGPIKTLAASGIKGMKKMLDYNAATSPLKANVTTEQVGNAAAFLCSDLASGVTGEIMNVDNGYNIMAMGQIEA